ncbi:MAG TPA: glycoside hydrolase family 15 protein [Acidimicrobiales bacterium]|nr:glycoside hydrolase family 15 protein [Acidimicrobiales bacterium]
MSRRLEDYALVGDTHTAALIGRDGSVDWLCVPRFDSSACFAALLGAPEHGRWLLAPASGGAATRRFYQDGTLMLVQEWDTPDGSVRVTDFMPPRHHQPRVYRRVEGLAGRVEMETDLVIRFEYGSLIPWVVPTGKGIRAVAGPDAIEVRSPVELVGEHMYHHARFEVHEGATFDFRLHWEPSYEPGGRDLAMDEAIAQTLSYWGDWGRNLREVHGEWEKQVQVSLRVLKALTYAPTGGIVAAPTTSLPEDLGGSRNWDYRYCWVRDATLTIDSLVLAGYAEEAEAWLWWLVRAAAGNPGQLQIMYGVAGERRLPELELDWLPGYESSRPVRVGNAASLQFQLDVFGELMEAVDVARSHGIATTGAIWDLQKAVLAFVVDNWERPDQGIWELRGPPQHLVHSRVMAWVALDRAVRAVDEAHLDGPVEVWRQVRDRVHEQVCRQGFNEKLGCFTQAYGSEELDASLLLLPLVGFLPIDDPRIVGTVAAVQKELVSHGFVMRYRNQSGVDGLAGDEGTFLPCTLWLVSCLALAGRVDEARELLARVAGVANDIGLFSEELDTKSQRLVGNFPQAFTHVAFVSAAQMVAEASRPGGGPAIRRRGRAPSK